ncbi:MAG: glyoxalase, partial [Burkholderiales bacterium]|nr:glyoxalase [Burkholderiales bacterium]
MKSPWICALRSVAFTVPDLAAARAFYTQVWKLEPAAEAGGVLYLRGSGSDHHVLALREAPGVPQLLKVTLRARDAAMLPAIAAAAVQAGGVVEQPAAPAPGPAGGTALLIRDGSGRRFEVVHGDHRRPA